MPNLNRSALRLGRHAFAGVLLAGLGGGFALLPQVASSQGTTYYTGTVGLATNTVVTPAYGPVTGTFVSSGTLATVASFVPAFVSGGLATQSLAPGQSNWLGTDQVAGAGYMNSYETLGQALMPNQGVAPYDGSWNGFGVGNQTGEVDIDFTGGDGSHYTSTQPLFDSSNTTGFQSASVGLQGSINDGIGDIAMGVGQSAADPNFFQQPSFSMQNENLVNASGQTFSVSTGSTTDIFSNESAIWEAMGGGNPGVGGTTNGHPGPFSLTSYASGLDPVNAMFDPGDYSSTGLPQGGTAQSYMTAVGSGLNAVYTQANGWSTDLAANISPDVPFPYLDFSSGTNIRDSLAIIPVHVRMPSDAVGDGPLVRAGITLFLYLLLGLYISWRVMGILTKDPND